MDFSVSPLINLLVVSVDPLFAEQLENIMGGIDAVEREQYRLTEYCLTADNIFELVTTHYDIIILDYSTENTACFDFLNYHVSGSKKAPLILVSEADDVDLEENAIKFVRAVLLIKGEFNQRELKRAIHYALDRRTTEDRLEKMAHYDALTGVPNRLLFRDRLNGAIQRANRTQKSFALLFIDLDGFKKVNDTFGHAVGDTLLSMIADRIKQCLRRSDSIARIGGDEFTVILENTEHISDITQVAKKIIRSVVEPCVIRGNHIVVGCSIGIATYNSNGKDAEQLLKAADTAMYQAKLVRSSCYRFYSEEMNEAAMKQLYVESELRRAIRLNEFELYYQPRVHSQTGLIVGMEALIRWRHSTKGIVAPDEFIPIAEETGLIVPIGYWVLYQACKDLKELSRLNIPRLNLAVNISVHQLQDDKFVETVTNVIERSGINPEHLEFELTESAMMANIDQAEECMQQIRRLGSRFSLDDFGTGYAAFIHLQRLPIAALKIDRSFINNVVENNEDAVIVNAMINLAHSLNMEIIAEGAETIEQVEFLRKHHCDEIQGFYYSPPVPYLQFQDLVVKQYDQRRGFAH